MYWVFTTLYTFLSIIIGQIVIEPNLRLLYYLTMLLLFASLNNVYYSSIYYIKLRNHNGVQGDRGDPGDKGQDGTDGVCLMSATCGIVNCRNLITKTLEDKMPIYKLINTKINNNQKLSSTEKKNKSEMNTYINILLPKCEQWPDDDVSGFETAINESINT